MIIDGKPEHWPKMIGGIEPPGEQSATQVLAQARSMIVACHERQGFGQEDWRAEHARTAHFLDVLGGLIADNEAIYEMYAKADKIVGPLREEIETLREALAESKRPLSAQMEMQNRRIIALTAELDRLKSARAPAP